MRIINGKDYYDSALSFGQDKSIIFVRNKDESIDLKVFPYVFMKGFDDFTDSLENLVMVVFCGKIYRGVYYPGIYLYPGTERAKTVVEGQFVWDYDSYKKRKDIDKEYGKDLSYYFPYKRYFKFNNKYVSPEFFFSPEENKIMYDYCCENNITTATFRYKGCYLHKEKKVMINDDSLKDYEFYRKIDPFTAYQEISMWVSGVLSNNHEPDQIKDEKIRIEKHGFDSEKSFRKEPTKKKFKKKKVKIRH